MYSSRLTPSFFECVPEKFASPQAHTTRPIHVAPSTIPRILQFYIYFKLYANVYTFKVNAFYHSPPRGFKTVLRLVMVVVLDIIVRHYNYCASSVQTGQTRGSIPGHVSGSTL